MNATVTLPLSEIDALRNDLQKAVDRVKELESTQKKIKVEMYEQYTAFKTDPYHKIAVPYSAWKEYPHQYINMEDVTTTIRNEERTMFEKALNSKDKALRDVRDQYNKLEIKSSEKIKQLTEQYELEIKKLKGEKVDKQKDTILNEQIQMIDTLEKEVQSLTEVINELTTPWYIKLFSKHE